MGTRLPATAIRPALSRLEPPDLDADRLSLYRLAMHLSLVAGPLRLLDGDYPRRDIFLDIAEWNLHQVLSLRLPS
jgi:hypothetical protein